MDETVVISCEDDKGLCDSAIKAGISVVSDSCIYIIFQYLTTAPKSFMDETVVIACEDDKGFCDSAIKAGIPVVSAHVLL